MFLDGKISTLWGNIQQQHLDTLPKYKFCSSSLWAQRLIKAGWTMIREIWELRNEKAHELSVLEDLEGRPSVVLAIKEEWKIGLHRLPTSFTIMFKRKLQDLLQMSLSHLKDWLLTLRLGRELHHDTLVQDEFCKKGSRDQGWIIQHYVGRAT